MSTVTYVSFKVGEVREGCGLGDKLSGFHARTAASFVKIAMMCEKQHDVIISLYTQQETWVGGKAISTGSYVRFPTNDLMALMVAELFPGARAFLKFEGEGIVDAVEAMKLFFTKTVFTESAYTVLDDSEVPDGINEAVYIDDMQVL